MCVWIVFNERNKRLMFEVKFPERGLIGDHEIVVLAWGLTLFLLLG